MNTPKPVIGISCGDINGIGLELIIKTFMDSRMLEHCTPVIFASNKVINFYKKTIPDCTFNFASCKELNRISPKQINVFNCWEDEVDIQPGQLTPEGGKYGIISLQTAVAALKQKQIDGLITAPIHKKNIQSFDFTHPGHTPYLQEVFGVKDVVMLMVSNDLRIGLVTEHVSVAQVAGQLSKERILHKLQVLQQSLQKDFGIDKPRIAVLALNPHAGDEGVIGKEEESIIRPAIKEAKNNNILAVGPYPADAFFARGSYAQFDAVLAMYHDQGLIPFKTIAGGEGVNFTAGLPAVRTSPDHGVAFDIAGKNLADPQSFITAIFECIDIINRRNGYASMRSNPLRKASKAMLANAKDESLED